MDRIFIFSDRSTWRQCDDVDHFRRVYSYIRAFHGCRPEMIDTYLQDGLTLPTEKKLMELAFKQFGSKYSKEMLRQKVRDSWNRYPAKGIYFCLDRAELMEFCGHYMIYGSELVNGIAAELRCQHILKRTGIPTVFSVNLPVNMVDDYTIQELIDEISNDFDGAKIASFGFRITDNLDPKYIVGYENPAKIKDPLERYQIYRFNWTK